MGHPKGTARPLSGQAVRALDAGYDHPEGHVFAPLGTTQAMIRRGLVEGIRRELAAGFGDHVRTTITTAGRREVVRARAAALDAELNPASAVEVIAPSWDAFEPCPRSGCRALTGQPCIDLRGKRGSDGQVFRLAVPHRGRRQLGPRADSLAHRTGRAS